MQSVTTPESEQQIATMFNRIAPRYDFLNRLLSMRQDERWRKIMAREVPQIAGGKLLDVATGTGDVLVACAKAHPEYSLMRGGDISEKMIDRAIPKTLPLHTPVQAIDLKVMSATNLVADASSFDVVTIAFGLRNVVDREKALSEFNRVLRRNGVLLIMDFFEPASHLIAWGFRFYFHKILPTIGGIFSDRGAYKYLPASVGGFYKPQELAARLKEHGFKVEKEISFLFGACRIFKASKN